MRNHLVRYGGLLGALLLAVAAYHGGAMRRLPSGVTPATIARGEDGPLILTTWLVGTAVLVAAWLALRGREPSTRWAYVTCALWWLPLLFVAPMGSRDVYAYACQGAIYAAGGDPYQPGGSFAAGGCPWIESVSVIWRDTPAPYGPLFVLVAGVAAKVGGDLTATIALLRIAAVAGVALLAWRLPALARAAGVDERRATWLVLACPLLAVHVVAGAHNDGLMVGLLVAGLALAATAAGPGARVAAGVLVGLAVMVKATAIVALPFAVLVAVSPGVLRRPYQLRKLIRDGGLVVGGAGLAVVAATLVSGLGFGWVTGLTRSGDSVQWTSPPTAVGLAIEWATGWPAVGSVRLVALIALAVVLLGLFRWAATGGDPLRAAGYALAATVALSPVFHPWYLVWPLAVLAATSARTRAVAAVSGAAAFLVLPDGTNLARFTKVQGALAMTLLLVVLGFARRPSRRRDPV